MVRSFVAPVVLLLASCGSGSVCEKWAEELDACEDDDFDVESCEEEIASCNAEDVDLLDDFYECADEAGIFDQCDGEMTATNLTDALGMMGAIFACAEPLEGLSEECQSEMMTGSTAPVL